MRKIQFLPAREQIAMEIKNAILDGEFTPGTELIQEKLAEQLGVSRMPIREAFLILERDRFIHLMNGRKAIVREFSLEDLNEHYELRALLEGEAAAKAACKQTDLAQLLQYHETMKTTSDHTEFRKLNRLFHEEIWTLSGGSRIHDLIASLWAHIPPVVMKDADQRSNQEHELIVRALRNHDEEGARKQMKEHIVRSQQDYLKFRSAGE